MTTYGGFLRRCSRSHDTIEAAVADNCRFDERAGVGRWQRFENLLSALVADGDAGRAVHSFFDAWNQRRDARPAFAAFYDEVQQESDEDDWPHALRDRLGLGHYGQAGGASLPVALMRYSLADVYSAQAQQQLSTACALPTPQIPGRST